MNFIIKLSVMNFKVAFLIIFFLTSCVNRNQPVDNNDDFLGNDKLKESTYTTSIQTERDTLFADYYHGMSVEALDSMPKTYTFNSDNDELKFDIEFEIEEGKLVALDLTNKGEASEGIFNYLLSIYRNKYGKPEVSTKPIKLHYKTKYEIANVSWGDENKHYYTDPEKVCEFKCFYDFDLNYKLKYKKVKNFRKDKFHTHVMNKYTGHYWIFNTSISVKEKLYADFEQSLYTYKSKDKNVILERRKLLNPDKYVSKIGGGLKWDIRRRDNFPDSYIKIVYSLKKHKEKVEKREQREKYYLDSLRNMEKMKNKSDI